MATVEATLVRALIGRTAFEKVKTFEALKLNMHLLARPGGKKETAAAAMHFREYVTACQFVELGCRCVACGVEIAAGDKVVIGKTDVIPRILIMCEANFATHHAADSIMHNGCARSSRKPGGVRLLRELNELKLQLGAVCGQYLFKPSEALRRLVGDDQTYEIITTGNAKMMVPLVAPPAPPSILEPDDNIIGDGTVAIVGAGAGARACTHAQQHDTGAVARYIRLNTMLTLACLIMLVVQTVLIVVL